MVLMFANEDVLDICSSVEDAVQKKCYLAALALALTIPDIYGAVEYPKLAGEKNTGKRYRKWFDAKVKGYEALKHPLGDSGSKYPTLDGYLCYLLRCRVLHSGDADIEVPDLEFTLMIHEGSKESPADSTGLMTRSWDDKTIKKLNIDVVHLCLALSNAGITYVDGIIKANDTDKLNRINANRLEVIDLDNISQFRNRYN